MQQVGDVVAVKRGLDLDRPYIYLRTKKKAGGVRRAYFEALQEVSVV